jgi:hypothetical protein
VEFNGSIDGIAASITIGIINYVLLGFQFPVDAFYLHSFEIWLATVVVFFGSGTLGYTLLEVGSIYFMKLHTVDQNFQYRLGHKELVS